MSARQLHDVDAVFRESRLGHLALSARGLLHVAHKENESARNGSKLRLSGNAWLPGRALARERKDPPSVATRGIQRSGSNNLRTQLSQARGRSVSADAGMGMAMQPMCGWR